jgi:hypothetical protein
MTDVAALIADLVSAGVAPELVRHIHNRSLLDLAGAGQIMLKEKRAGTTLPTPLPALTAFLVHSKETSALRYLLPFPRPAQGEHSCNMRGCE